jgi:hypothetical protein
MGVAAAIFGAGHLSGQIKKRRRMPKPPPKPICGCSHHFALHDKDGRCHEVQAIMDDREVVVTDPSGKPVKADGGYTRVDVHTVIIAEMPCACQHYSGPIPHDAYFATEIGS